MRSMQNREIGTFLGLHTTWRRKNVYRFLWQQERRKVALNNQLGTFFASD